MLTLLDKLEHLQSDSKSIKALQAHIDLSKFIRKSWFDNWCSQALTESSIGIVSYIKNLLLSVIKLDLTYWKSRKVQKLILKNRDEFRHIANSEIVKSILQLNKSYFDTVEKFPLTDKQREAVASDDDFTLVIAGAGTGKTSTIVAKIGYLLRTHQCAPSEILAISYTRLSADELAERIKKILNVEIQVSTFHKLGIGVISHASNVKPKVAAFATDPTEKAKYIKEITDLLIKDDEFRKCLVEFVTFYRIQGKQLWEFESLAEYVCWMRSNKIISLDGKPKKSYQECLIANYLILNGIKFVYEMSYEYRTATTEKSQYCPDFYLSDDHIYIEHIGIDKGGKTAKFINNELYWEGINWKRRTHKECETKLIETYSWEHSEGTLLSNLDAILRSHGCKFNPITVNEALVLLNQAGYVDGLSELVSNFLTLYKGNGETIFHEKLSKDPLEKDRQKRFLEIFKKIFTEYTAKNKVNNQIDFEDMITLATEATKAGSYKNPYRYILVDEFQDISPGRASLLKSLTDNLNDSALFVVGDDWQSIYRFAGSDIGVMTKFENFFDSPTQVALDTTFRFDKKTIDVSSTFVLKNKSQISKILTSIRKSDNPSIVIYKRRSKDHEAPLDWSLREIEKRIGSDANASVLVLERYKHDLPDSDEWARLQHLFPRLTLKSMSVHKAKGLEADYVIVGLRGGVWGFPSQLVDDPLMNLVLSQEDEFEYGEERRLFYVAITRARTATFLVCEIDMAHSVFAHELEYGNEYPVSIAGIATKALYCKRCNSGTMLLRDGFNGKFYGCSNFPYCNNVEQVCPKCREGMIITDVDVCKCHLCGHEERVCPKCKMGILQTKKGPFGEFFGCSNYKDPVIRCRYTEKQINQS